MKSQKVCDSKWPSWQVPEIEKDVRRRQNESPKPVKAQKRQTQNPAKLKNDKKNVVLCRLTPGNVQKDSEEGSNLSSKGRPEDPEIFMRKLEVLISINFVVLNDI